MKRIQTDVFYPLPSVQSVVNLLQKIFGAAILALDDAFSGQRHLAAAFFANRQVAQLRGLRAG
jgi:hypothetical protein